MNSCEILRQFLLLHLARDIEAHEAGRIQEIGRAEADLPYDLLNQCAAEDEAESERISIAIEFWDRWMDARNHEWGYYSGVTGYDWPIVARQICQGLAERWAPDRMRENAVFNPPPKPSRVPLWQRIRIFFGR